MPLLRIDQSDLKCKNGCDFYGNPQWQGYCSKCHREQMHRQRRAEKGSSATLPKPDKKAEKNQSKLQSHSSFSKFEKKRQHQSDTLKKANLLKFSVFKKSNSTASEEHDREPSDSKNPEFKIPPLVNDYMKKDFKRTFPSLGSSIDRDCRQFVHGFIMDVIRNVNMNVDDLSDRVQRQYQRFMKHMESSPHYSYVEPDTRELLIDFVEKHAMTYLNDLASIVFSPSTTDDERADRLMSERIQQLGWVCQTHLECKVDPTSGQCRQLLYKAIGELLEMDGASSPGEKLSCVRRSCRHVLSLVSLPGTPASADDLLPALIFTVLKANPPRLKSNINFVSRFCNANRLMTGEGGYYFTNLCCAVEFIEKLTADQLNMEREEFECHMNMPASIGGSQWAAALSLSAEMKESEELKSNIEELNTAAIQIEQKANELNSNAQSFLKEITNKVEDILKKTPLQILPRRELPRFGKSKNIKTAPLIDLGPNLSTEIPTVTLPEDKSEELDFEVIEKPEKDIKQSSSMELLTPSPLGFSFDTKSIDELMTPDEFGDHLAPGLSNVNYDIDLSDLSGENSTADDPPKDPFSPEGIHKGTVNHSFDPDPFIMEPFKRISLNPTPDPFSLVPHSSNANPPDQFSPFAHNSQFSATAHSSQMQEPFSPFVNEEFSQFDLFSSISTKNHKSQNQDPFSPIGLNKPAEFDPFSRVNSSHSASTSLLDNSDSPTGACLLPSPLLPQNTGDK